MATCEICGAEADPLNEHHATKHGVHAMGVGNAGTFYVELKTLGQVATKPRSRARRK